MSGIIRPKIRSIFDHDEIPQGGLLASLVLYAVFEASGQVCIHHERCHMRAWRGFCAGYAGEIGPITTSSDYQANIREAEHLGSGDYKRTVQSAADNSIDVLNYFPSPFSFTQPLLAIAGLFGSTNRHYGSTQRQRAKHYFLHEPPVSMGPSRPHRVERTRPGLQRGHY